MSGALQILMFEQRCASVCLCICECPAFFLPETTPTRFIGIRIHMTAINLHPLSTWLALSCSLSMDTLLSCTITIALNALHFAPRSHTFSPSQHVLSLSRLQSVALALPVTPVTLLFFAQGAGTTHPQSIF